MKSMTGYAQKIQTLQGKRYRLEIQSLNKKGLDIQTDFPSQLLSLSVPVKLYLAEVLQRGSVLVRLREEGSFTAVPSVEELKLLKAHLEKLALGCGYGESAIPFSFLIQNGNWLGSLKEVSFEEFKPLVKETVEALEQMRETEGIRLKEDFFKRLDLIEGMLIEVEEVQKTAPLNIKERLIEKLAVLNETSIDPERVAKEVIFYVEKQDVTEEITRLKSHLFQFRDLLKKNEAVGRKLEFLTQECFRELNTLAAKTSELGSIRLSLNLKTEFEKVKEQVMNIE